MKPFFCLPHCPSCGVQQPYRSILLSWVGKGHVCRRCKNKIKFRFTIRTLLLVLFLLAVSFLINSFLMARIDSILPVLFVTFLLVAFVFFLMPFTMGSKKQKK